MGCSCVMAASQVQHCKLAGTWAMGVKKPVEAVVVCPMDAAATYSKKPCNSSARISRLIMQVGRMVLLPRPVP